MGLAGAVDGPGIWLRYFSVFLAHFFPTIKFRCFNFAYVFLTFHLCMEMIHTLGQAASVTRQTY
jgi:hypothetical protein